MVYNILMTDLSKRRQAAGLTQRDLARLIGCSQAAVSLWERDRTTPRPWTRRAIEQALAGK
jgi:transcriptional regulator with XRE-family HTH domain